MLMISSIFAQFQYVNLMGEKKSLQFHAVAILYLAIICLFSSVNSFQNSGVDVNVFNNSPDSHPRHLLALCYLQSPPSLLIRSEMFALCLHICK